MYFREILKCFRKTAKFEFFAKQIIYLESSDQAKCLLIELFAFESEKLCWRHHVDNHSILCEN